MKGRQGSKEQENDSWVTWMKHRVSGAKAKFQIGSTLGGSRGTLVMAQPLSGVVF